jgi:hypothetical protein
MYYHFGLFVLVLSIFISLLLPLGAQEALQSMPSSPPLVFSKSHHVIDISGNSFLFPADDGIIGRQLQLFGQWEKPSISLVTELLLQHHDESKVIVFDVGANFGT